MARSVLTFYIMSDKLYAICNCVSGSWDYYVLLYAAEGAERTRCTNLMTSVLADLILLFTYVLRTRNTYGTLRAYANDFLLARSAT